MEKINKIHKKNTKIVDTYLTGMPFKGATLCHEDIEAQPRPQGFSLKKWVEKPWGRG